MNQYQKRMTKFVWVSNSYGVGCTIALLWTGAPIIGWIILASTIVLLTCIAAACDAVYDSLTEQHQRILDKTLPQCDD